MYRSTYDMTYIAIKNRLPNRKHSNKYKIIESFDIDLKKKFFFTLDTKSICIIKKRRKKKRFDIDERKPEGFRPKQKHLSKHTNMYSCPGLNLKYPGK